MKKLVEKKQARRELIAFIGFFYLIPIALLYFRFFPFWSRHLILTLMGLILAAYAIGKPVKLRELGFRGDNLKVAMLWNGLVTAIVLGGVFVAAKYGLIKPSYLGGETILFYIFYVFISAPIQEFVFRSLMFYELNLLIKRGDVFKVFFSAFIFSIAHIMYKDPLVLAATFAVGLMWGFVYLKKPNFWGVALSHAIIGAVTVFFGFV